MYFDGFEIALHAWDQGSKGTLLAIQEFVDDDQIPVWLGGTYQHGDDEFSSSVIAAVCVLCTFYHHSAVVLWYCAYL